MESGAAYSLSSVVEKATAATFGKPLVVNVARGQLVEAMVALALEPKWAWCSADYSGWDFVREDGLRLEVKQSAARQSWPTSKPSTTLADCDFRDSPIVKCVIHRVPALMEAGDGWRLAGGS